MGTKGGRERGNERKEGGGRWAYLHDGAADDADPFVLLLLAVGEHEERDLLRAHLRFHTTHQRKKREEGGGM